MAYCRMITSTHMAGIMVCPNNNLQLTRFKCVRCKLLFVMFAEYRSTSQVLFIGASIVELIACVALCWGILRVKWCISSIFCPRLIRLIIFRDFFSFRKVICSLFHSWCMWQWRCVSLLLSWSLQSFGWTGMLFPLRLKLVCKNFLEKCDSVFIRKIKTRVICLLFQLFVHIVGLQYTRYIRHWKIRKRLSSWASSWDNGLGSIMLRSSIYTSSSTKSIYLFGGGELKPSINENKPISTVCSHAASILPSTRAWIVQLQ